MKILLFARARDLAGAAEIVIELAPSATVADLRHVLANRYPSLASLLERCAVAVDNEIADASTPISPTAVVALLPPVSGG
jgi:molybdopterin synthase catalytic subunit/molybdopterin synthase sulfur carrier subunit